MKDEELELEEIEASHTLGAAVIHTQIRQSRGLRHTMPVWVAITDTPPVYKHLRGGCLFIVVYYESLKRALKTKTCLSWLHRSPIRFWVTVTV